MFPVFLSSGCLQHIVKNWKTLDTAHQKYTCTMWFNHGVMCPKDADKMKNSVKLDQTVPFEQFDQDLHCLPITICPNRCNHCGLRALVVYHFISWATAWQNQQNGMCAQWSLRSAWASAQNLCCALNWWLRTQAFFMRTAKILIRLDRCPGWSESLLGPHAILLVLSWGGSHVKMGRQSKRLSNTQGDT